MHDSFHGRVPTLPIGWREIDLAQTAMDIHLRVRPEIEPMK